MSQNEPNWQLYLLEVDGQVISEQNKCSNENASPNWTNKTNEEPNKVSSKKEMIQDFIDGEKSKNTLYKTKSDLNIFSRYLAKENESRNIETIPAGELDTYLAELFMTVCKQNGEEYELSSLSSIIAKKPSAVFGRPSQRPKSQINILKDDEFKQSRNTLMSKRK